MKSSLENEKAQYVQYVYDEQGNKVRQFTGMTGPLTVMVAAVENAKDDAGKDTFTYGGKTYAVLVTGKKKSDTIRETKYVYDTKNRLVSYTDPEGRTETYTYDCNSNLTKTVDKNEMCIRDSCISFYESHFLSLKSNQIDIYHLTNVVDRKRHDCKKHQNEHHMRF